MTLRSRVVDEASYYRIEIHSSFIDVSKITYQQAIQIAGDRQEYLHLGQYLEGTDYKNLVIKNDSIHQFNNIGPFTLPPNLSGIYKYTYNTYNNSSTHTCTDFKWYIGLVEKYEYCLVCEKKR